MRTGIGLSRPRSFSAIDDQRMGRRRLITSVHHGGNVLHLPCWASQNEGDHRFMAGTDDTPSLGSPQRMASDAACRPKSDSQ